MKKVLAFVISFAIALCVFGVDYTPVSAESDSTVSGDLTVTGTVQASGSGVVAATAQVSATTNAVDSTEFTPAYAGQLLIFSVSNVVYVAEDTTTNGWIEISN